MGAAAAAAEGNPSSAKGGPETAAAATGVSPVKIWACARFLIF